ncbi:MULTISPECIES: flagellar export chaperone FliS [Thalassospira]|jgi:flagellar protein FliS|uniref:flagellar export chaperone FliS n=1 Tax=Thalassospira TaxID=168934 RepID=UPI0007A57A88|nr:MULTISPECIES: flagellar export chaperone FliS [unclassified Thalassospira]KZD00212.1 hypothetical protein AUQ41_06360 [Thalassospira sp. MCCC 1A02898]ONH87122.1 flagellar biosynthesis protein FliS [Thalassospira sp. MCCC 1A02803]BDW88003.1 flagellar protein FliS [Thalassospira tepidiphila]
MNEHAAQAYKQQQVNTASPAKMVFMLYEKVIARLQEAKHAIDQNDIQARCNANCNAQELLAHLSNTLDMEQGGEIAANLERIYTHCILRLMDVDRHNDPQAASEVISLMTPLRDSWAELAEKSDSELRQTVSSVKNEQGSYSTRDNSSSHESGEQAPKKSGLSISA